MASIRVAAEQEASGLLRRRASDEAQAVAVQALATLALAEAIEGLGEVLGTAIADGRLRVSVQVESDSKQPIQVEVIK